MSSGVRELFPLGDVDESVVATMAERFPGLPVDDAAAALGLGRVIVRFLEEVPTPIIDAGLSPARWRLLVALIAQAGPEGARIGELAGHLGIREPTVTATVDRAEADGLVRRSRDVGDRRIVRVSITTAGKELVAEVLPAVTQRLVALVAALGGPDVTARLAARLDDAVDAVVAIDTKRRST